MVVQRVSNNVGNGLSVGGRTAAATVDLVRDSGQLVGHPIGNIGAQTGPRVGSDDDAVLELDRHDRRLPEEVQNQYGPVYWASNNLPPDAHITSIASSKLFWPPHNYLIPITYASAVLGSHPVVTAAVHVERLFLVY